ncbi:2'-5' RNA ligase family protein [Bacillus sp. SCS-151]|uniref:2'-5' RNA ligase family protein n=1 Tax=Nanhaiella sioensis TaxID=3115293 RepID=UPI00397BB33D
MQYFIGIVPPEEYIKKIMKFQLQWENNELPNVVEPHITVKAQGGLTSDKDWLKDVEKVCEDTTPFKLKLSKVDFFEENVLFLCVESRELYKLHKEIVNAVSPEKDLIKKYMELDDYFPHLTLGQTHWGLSREELRDMAELTEEKLSPYPTINVDSLRVYQEIESNKYVKYLDIHLNKER